MSAIVADTHAIVWYFRSPEKLAYDASIAFDHAVNNGYPVHISAISIVEITYLVEKNRLRGLSSNCAKSAVKPKTQLYQ
ncbi:hypothetical protein NO976_04453 (plasmid) [Planktothrix agardhii]|jgi:PIN domain nuclease of toxin-antitoxin system|uniref:PIN domain-containing protein n=1 Tax=Planktothrix agardhii TaxID=1160 RepID=UPI0020A7DA83|nr:PIN domain-containing protein [Planktothrix agardhii]CAD5984740.1 hypothetical protein NO976_04453 [Planktothrix agardhii]